MLPEADFFANAVEVCILYIDVLYLNWHMYFYAVFAEIQATLWVTLGYISVNHVIHFLIFVNSHVLDFQTSIAKLYFRHASHHVLSRRKTRDSVCIRC